MMNVKVLAVALLLAASPAFAADVDGNWTGSLDAGNGPIDLAYTFKSDGNTLTGTTAGPDGGTLPLKNGMINGNQITFSIDVDFGQGPTTFKYTGTVTPAEIKLHTDFMGMPLDFVLKKAK